MLYEAYWDMTVYEMLEKMNRRFGEKELFFYREGKETVEISYARFFSDCQRLAGYLESRGLQGRRVVIDARNTYEQVVSFFAVMSMGAIACPLNFDLPEEEIAFALDRLEPGLLIYDTEDETLMPELAGAREIACICCTGSDESVRDILRGSGARYAWRGGQTPSDPALILMTSGSTSRSKLVVLPHYAVLPHSEAKTERSIFVLPMYHIAALNILINDMARGTPVCLSNLRNGMYDIEWFRPKDTFAVPMFVSMLVKQSRMGKMDISCFQNISSGGAPQDLEATEYLNSMGIFSMSLYGATETAGMVDYSTPEEYRFGSVGKPGPWNEIRVEEDGEILVRGKNMMLEYFGDEEATRAALRDGWYHTGDVGHMDGDGFLFITGRIKNIIILPNGENVSPEALEWKLAQCGEVEESVVCAEDGMIAAHIWCGADAGAEQEEAVRRFISRYNRTVPSYLAVRRVHFREQPFARTASNKIKRNLDV